MIKSYVNTSGCILFLLIPFLPPGLGFAALMSNGPRFGHTKQELDPTGNRSSFSGNPV